MRRYHVVFLDAQGTLLHSQPSVTALYADACQQCGKIVGQPEVAGTLRELWLEYKRSTQGQKLYDTSDEMTKKWWVDFNTRVFHRLGMEKGLEQFVGILWDIFGRPEIWRTFPEVEEVLVELRRRNYRLGVVSNWDSRLLSICEHLGITAHLDFVVASAAVGVEKPDQRIFQIALSRAGTPPDRAIHVGDDYEADVLGAQGSGIDAVHLVRDGNPPSAGIAIRNLRELLKILP